MKKLLLIPFLLSTPLCFAEKPVNEKIISRVKPSEFKNVPESVIKTLEKMNCLIPQAISFPPLPHNLISGHFASKNSKDWAAYCSINGKSSIQIIWEKSAPCPSMIDKGMDRDLIGNMGTVEKPKYEFSRLVSIANQKFILDQQKNYGGPLPKKLDHEGVSDIVVEKGSVVHYCENGKWIELQGSD